MEEAIIEVIQRIYFVFYFFQFLIILSICLLSDIYIFPSFFRIVITRTSKGHIAFQSLLQFLYQILCLFFNFTIWVCNISVDKKCLLLNSRYTGFTWFSFLKYFRAKIIYWKIKSQLVVCWTDFVLQIKFKNFSNCFAK